MNAITSTTTFSRLVQPCATPYGTDYDGRQIGPGIYEGCQPAEETFSPATPEAGRWPRQGTTLHPIPAYILHQRLPMCGHKLVPGREPRSRNCDPCWFAFFQIHKEVTETCLEVFRTHGLGALIQLRGHKFAQKFTAFMSTIAEWQQMKKEAA